MRKIMESLLALQQLQLEAGTAAAPAKVAKLRAAVPAPILTHYERLTVRGKKGVALARHGVCSECHLRITSAKLASLAAHQDIALCDNCGRYLYLPDEPPTTAGANLKSGPPAALKPTAKPAARNVV